MKLFDTVAIITDQHFDEHSLALRTVLEAMRLRVDYFRVVQDRNVTDFFAQRAGCYGLTIVFTHGTGPDGAPSIDFACVTQAEGDRTSTEDWRPTHVRLTPQTVDELIGRRGRGTFLTLACGSGRPALAEALLEQGYDTVIGPTDPYWSAEAALLFGITYCYGLLSQDRDYSQPYSPARAFEMARAMDPQVAHGPRVAARYVRGGAL